MIFYDLFVMIRHGVAPNEPFKIDDFKEGDAKVFKKFYDKHHSHACFFAKQMVGDREAAKDIVSEIFIKIWNSRRKFESISALQAYLYVCIKNACVNYIKQLKVVDAYRNFVMRSDDDFVDDLVLSGIYYKEVRFVLGQAIDSLPTQCRRVMKLSIEGMKTGEIATKLKLSPQTIRNTKGRAKEMLRDSLEEDMIGLD